MPELPEVETIRRGLAQTMIGEEIRSIQVLREKSFRGASARVIGARCTAVERRGKLIIFQLSNEMVLTCHLKMTGQLLFRAKNGAEVMGGHPESEYMGNLPGKHTRVVMTFTSGAELFFNDLRVFGYIEALPKTALPETNFLKTLGPEPFDAAFSLSYFKERMARRKKSVLKSFLLDQTHVAGLGNIYADEVCFLAKIDPRRLCESLQESEVEALYAAIPSVLQLALDHGGSSARDYVDAIGQKGTYLQVAKVYHRTGLPCARCGEKYLVQRVKIGGRSTHFCSHCQH